MAVEIVYIRYHGIRGTAEIQGEILDVRLYENNRKYPVRQKIYSVQQYFNYMYKKIQYCQNNNPKLQKT